MNPKLPGFLYEHFPTVDRIPDHIKLTHPVHQRGILINGQILQWDGPVHMVYSPIYVKQADHEQETAYSIGSYPLSTATEALAALDSAVNAFDAGRGIWPSLSLRDRILCLEEFTVRMVSKRDDIVRLIVWEIGKSISDAQKEFDRTVDYIRETIASAKNLHNRNIIFDTQQDFIGQTKKVPHGVVLCMGPFNYPLNETFTTLIPALIMGNTILFKPPKHGTLLFEPLLDAFKGSFPEGVVNTVYGRGKDIVPVLMQSGKIDVLALIGSSRVADSLKKMHPKSNRLKSILGLDAKNAAIVLPDADLDLTVKEIVAGALSFNGQRCTALKILFVHSAVVNIFNTMLCQEVEKLKIGMPWLPGISITPLAEPGKPQYLQECLEDAMVHGATVLNASSGGGSMCRSLVKPAIVYPVNNKMKLFKEEQFGPIIPVASFDNLQGPIDYVTGSPYGQQVSIFGQGSQEIAKLIDMLAGQVGRINLNSQCQRGPDTFAFNGRKDSAEGTLSVNEALLAFSTDSVVASKANSKNVQIIQQILSANLSSRLDSQEIV